MFLREKQIFKAIGKLELRPTKSGEKFYVMKSQKNLNWERTSIHFKLNGINVSIDEMNGDLTLLEVDSNGQFIKDEKNNYVKKSFKQGEKNDENVKLEEIVHPSSFNKNLDVIYSGSIPPNPTDLLSNGKYEVLIETLKEKYDYIILDTAPLMLVTDSFLISEVADITLYVTRSKYTEKSLIDFANKVMDAGKIKNAAFILNDVDKDYFGYGNKYGYGYGVDNRNIFQKIKDRFLK